MKISDDYSKAVSHLASELGVTTSVLKKVLFTILEALPESPAPLANAAHILANDDAALKELAYNFLSPAPEPKPVEVSREIEAVLSERKRQDAKWGIQNHGPYAWLLILMEEVGEAAKAILEGSALNYIKELSHAAAVAVAAMECANRGNLEIDSLTKAQEEIRRLRSIDPYR